MQRGWFTQAVHRSFERNRTPLDWAAFALTVVITWLVVVGCIILTIFWVPSTRLGWVLFVVFGPPVSFLTVGAVGFVGEWFSKTRFYQVFFHDPSSATRIWAGVLLGIAVILGILVLVAGCDWLIPRL